MQRREIHQIDAPELLFGQVGELVDAEGDAGRAHVVCIVQVDGIEVLRKDVEATRFLIGRSVIAAELGLETS